MRFLVLRRIEIVARILSLIAIPVVIAIFGANIQTELSDRTLRREYVQIAVSVLANPLKSPDNDPLKDWAVQLLAENAPIKLSDAALSQLRTGPQRITKVEYVEVPTPIPVPCGPIKIKRPKFPYDDAKDTMTVDQHVALLLADKLTREGYINELEAVLVACRGENPRAAAKAK